MGEGDFVLTYEGDEHLMVAILAADTGKAEVEIDCRSNGTRPCCLFVPRRKSHAKTYGVKWEIQD